MIKMKLDELCIDCEKDISNYSNNVSLCWPCFQIGDRRHYKELREFVLRERDLKFEINEKMTKINEKIDETILWIKNKKKNSSDKKRMGIGKEVRKLFLDSFENKCVNCGSDENIEIDHIMPLSKGGKNIIKNLQLLCRECNSLKSNNMFNEQQVIKNE